MKTLIILLLMGTAGVGYGLYPYGEEPEVPQQKLTFTPAEKLQRMKHYLDSKNALEFHQAKIMELYVGQKYDPSRTYAMPDEGLEAWCLKEIGRDALKASTQ